MDDEDVQVHAVSLPPFLFCTSADDEAFTTGIVAQGNDELAGTSPRHRTGCWGSATCRSAGRGSRTRPGERSTTSGLPA